jgi:hypothetical protein
MSFKILKFSKGPSCQSFSREFYFSFAHLATKGLAVVVAADAAGWPIVTAAPTKATTI